MGLRNRTNIATLITQWCLLDHDAELMAASRPAPQVPPEEAWTDDMSAEIHALESCSRHTRDGIRMARQAARGLEGIHELLSRMRLLAAACADALPAEDVRAAIDEEFQDLLEDLARLSGDTSFNGTSLLNAFGGTRRIQVGIDPSEAVAVELPDVGPEELGIARTKVSAPGDAAQAITSLDAALHSVGRERDRMTTVLDHLHDAETQILLSPAPPDDGTGPILEPDHARRTARLLRRSILQRPGLSLLAQANVDPTQAVDHLAS